MQDRADYEAPYPAAQTPTLPIQNAGPSKNAPPPTLLIQPTLSVIPTINPKQRKGKNSGALKKSRKIIAALVDAQLTIDKQWGIHLIKPPSGPSEKFTYRAPNPKGNPFLMPAITQDYNNNDALEPKVVYFDDQWKEEATEILPRRSQRLMQTAHFMCCPPAGIS